MDAPPDDPCAELCRRAATGDAAAFDALVAATHHDLRCFVAAHAWDVMMIDEVVQTAYITCFSSLSSYRTGAPPLPWLKGIARRHLLQAQEERRRHRRRHPDALAALIEQPADENDQDEDPRLARLRACLTRLPAQARQLIDGFYLHGRSLAELAERTQRTRAAVAMALSRIRSALHACVAKAGHD